jgi:hypothetical protein
MNNPIDSTGIFDSRQLIEYKEYLESEILDAYIEWAEDVNDYKEEDAEDLEIPDLFEEIEFIEEEAFTIYCEDLLSEYEDIKNFIDELEGYGDFDYGETIISEYYFEDYCEDYLKDCGYLPDNLPALIENNIDFKGIADDMKQDYTEVEYYGTTYLMRY